MVRKLERRKQTIVIDEQLINGGNEKRRKTNIKLNLIALQVHNSRIGRRSCALLAYSVKSVDNLSIVGAHCKSEKRFLSHEKKCAHRASLTVRL
jgi:hypothetical protein